MSETFSVQSENNIRPAAKKTAAQGALISKNVRIHDRRTSIRLEPEMWDALKEIADIENCSIHDLCGAVHDLKEEGASFTAALRVFLMEYYRTVAKTSHQVGRVQRHLKNGMSASVADTVTEALHKITA
jgi:predicted DNA-binding ribbon-helix-helix protein